MPNQEVDTELIEKAGLYQGVVGDPKWKPLLDSLALINDSILAQIRLTPVWEREKITDLALTWKNYEQYLMLIQNEVFGTIEQRNEYIRQVLRDRLPEEKIEDLIRRGGTPNI